MPHTTWLPNQYPLEPLHRSCTNFLDSIVPLNIRLKPMSHTTEELCQYLFELPSRKGTSRQVCIELPRSSGRLPFGAMLLPAQDPLVRSSLHNTSSQVPTAHERHLFQ